MDSGPALNSASRNDTLHRVEPAETDRIALAAQQAHRLVKRQPDHIAVGADQLDHEGAGNALDRVAAGLAAPFAGGEVGLDVLGGEPLEADPGFNQAVTKRLARRDDGDRGVDAVIAA